MVILFTSGSTGVPKAVELEQHSIANFCHWYAKDFELTADDRVSAYANFGFDAHMMDIYPAIFELKNMISEGLLHTSTLNLSMEDFQFQLNNKMCAAAFLRLSDHRQISRSVIEDYTTIYCPEIQKADAGRDADRTFSAPKIAAVKLKNNRRADNVLVRLSNTNQTELCSYSGLAPVQRECQVPDHQADDVRYWLAASKGPVLPLAAALPSKEARTAAAIYFRNLLQQQ